MVRKLIVAGAPKTKANNRLEAWIFKRTLKIRKQRKTIILSKRQSMALVRYILEKFKEK